MPTNYQDIYFTESWQQLNAQRDGNTLDRVHFSCEAGSVEYGFCRRNIEIRGEHIPYQDIVTPYAFAGPMLMPREDTAECRAELAKQFDAYFQQYCLDTGIVAEYCQFSPWLKNHEAFAPFYTLDYRTHIVGIDLTKDDLMSQELNGRRRRAVRSAQKQGVQIFFDDKGDMIDEFLRIYEFTVSKYNAIDYYQFDRPFMEKMFSQLPGMVRFAYAMVDGKCASICMLLKYGNYIHYHLAGNDPALSHTNASSLLIYEAARKAQEEHYRLFVLGGAEGALLQFKQTFTQNTFFDYYAGKKIRNPEVYDQLVRKNGILQTLYFPAYRDNGNVQFNNWLAESDDT